jgi:poly(3-hydroxybutyrate) depolymerase
MHLVKNDGEPAEKHRDFYDEYLAVMDLTAEFYLQTVDQVFIKHALPKGELEHRGKLVDPAAIRNVALLTVEGENDDISGVGQTKAAQTICVNIPENMRMHYVQPDVGHYGVFNGSRFRAKLRRASSTSCASTDAPASRSSSASSRAANPSDLDRSELVIAFQGLVRFERWPS